MKLILAQLDTSVWRLARYIIDFLAKLTGECFLFFCS
jgi:hypothetical protein